MAQIDDMETLRSAKEDDLRKAGLKMGDIIRIRHFLAKDEQAVNMEPENSSFSSTDSENPIQRTLAQLVIVILACKRLSFIKLS